MRLYDTRTRQKRPLRAARTVRLYVCGITPYDASHLGHAFTYVQFDVLVRWLTERGHRVRYARNVTDVDDDILRTARERGVDYRKIAAVEMARFARDLDTLGCLPPDVEPRATAAVPAILATVRGLVDARVAYPLDDGRVYFDVSRAERFGELSGLDREAMLAQFGDSGGDPDASGKRDPLDFLLWQPSASDEPAWDSDWGPGRPGWHIECSTMAMEELGPTIDLHGGGADLVYPHHEAEIVQAESLTGQRPFSRFWLHAGLVGGPDGAKMAKSVGNLVFVDHLCDQEGPAAVRRLLLDHHYREHWSYTDAYLREAAKTMAVWQDAAAAAAEQPDGGRRDTAVERTVTDALDDDLDTPRALAALDAAASDGAGGTVRWGVRILGMPLGPAVDIRGDQPSE